MPNYAVLIYATDSAHALDATADDLAEPDGHSDEVVATGRMRAAYAFTPRELARSITAAGVQGGPFLGASSPIVAGVYVIEADDMDDALALAGTNPAIRDQGGVEVRLIHSSL